jgi:hypothetical protein
MDTSTPRSAAAPAEALRELAAFPLVEALFGRRSRRFALGDEIPDGPLAYTSRQQPLPLGELERMLDLEFYDRFFKPGAYLRTHAEHMARWHGQREEG